MKKQAVVFTFKVTADKGRGRLIASFSASPSSSRTGRICPPSRRRAGTAARREESVRCSPQRPGLTPVVIVSWWAEEEEGACNRDRSGWRRKS